MRPQQNKEIFASSRSLTKAFCERRISAEQIATVFLERVAQRDPAIGAFLHINNADVLLQARALDQKLKDGKKVGLLAAVPVALKDNIAQRGSQLTCASKILEGYISPFDATVTRLIRDEDGIIFGKTNLDEFAMGSSCENSALQKTVNPYDASLTPGGSSGGSAAAVCAGMAPLALGSDTGGSIRLPASFCGITAFKPTYGRISRFGLVAFGSSLDQIGPFARTAEEIEHIMQVIGRQCSRDSTSNRDAPFQGGLPASDGMKLKIGIPWSFLEGLQKEVKDRFLASLDVMKTSYGASVYDVDLSLLKYSVAVYYILATAEVSTNLARFDGVRYGRRAPTAETLEQVYELSREEGFGPEVKRRILLGTFVLSSGYQDAYYTHAQKVRRRIVDQFRTAFGQVDMIAMPVSGGAAFPFGSKKDPVSMYLEDIYTIGPNLAGLPAISLPMGALSDGRPLGLQIIGPQRSDERVVHLGKLFQRTTGHHLLRPMCCRDDV